MRRISVFIAFCLLAVALFGTGVMAADKDVKKESYGGTTFEYPADWITQDNDQGTMRYYYANSENFLMVTTTSLGEYNTDGISDEDAITIMDSYLQGVESSGGVIGEKEMKDTAGCKGFHFYFGEKVNDKDYECDSYVFMKGTNLYSFAFAYPKDDGNKYADQFAAILKSIKVDE